MFIGHFGIGFGAKATAPKVSLGTLFLAAQFIDLVWPTLLLLGIERVNIRTDGSQYPPLDFVYYPFSHSLLAVMIWAVLFATIYYAIRRSRTSAMILGIAVVSHWLLDLIVHYRDLPLYPPVLPNIGDSPLLGLAVWSSLIVEMALEFSIFALGVWLYLRATRAVDATGTWALWLLVIFLLTIHIGNTLGPPPPSTTALAWVGQTQWLLVAWGYWVDRHRVQTAK
jgi:hypothetical protein